MMAPFDADRLRNDALAIWQAGVDAVRSDHLVERNIQANQRSLSIAGQVVSLSPTAKIAVVGGGKAGAKMALGCERALGDLFPPERRVGWLNVPADCVQPTDWIHLHPARPAGVNEPTAEGVDGTREILNIVRSLTPEDVCIVLLSGGGSALLPAPLPGITLADKQAITRFLMHSGATIHELNRVRRKLSQIKGGGLARACGAGEMFVLVLSDVLGDPLDIIASGPTIPDDTPAGEVVKLLRSFPGHETAVPPSVWKALDTLVDAQSCSEAATAGRSPLSGESLPTLTHHIIGNNQTALSRSGEVAVELGYDLIDIATNVGGEAAELGRTFARRAIELQSSMGPSSPRPLCLLSGGEPVVRFDLMPVCDSQSVESDVEPGLGGRNQELVLSALVEFGEDTPQGILLLSGGTDGEDGPTDAAGGIADELVWHNARQQSLDPTRYLANHNSYRFLDQADGLIKTGPTHTNVMDVRVLLVAPAQ